MVDREKGELHIIWDVDDITYVAGCLMAPGETLSREEALDILDELDRTHDSKTGLNWRIVGDKIREYLAERNANSKFARAVEKFTRKSTFANVNSKNRSAPLNTDRPPTDSHGVDAIFRFTDKQNAFRQSLKNFSRVIERINFFFQKNSPL